MVRTAIRFHKQLTLLVIDGFCIRGHLRTRRGRQANNIHETSVWRQAFSNRHSMVALLKRCTTFLSGTFYSLGKLSTHAICRCYLLNPSTSCDCLFPWWCALASKLVCHATKSRQDFALHRILSDLLKLLCGNVMNRCFSFSFMLATNLHAFLCLLNMCH